MTDSNSSPVFPAKNDDDMQFAFEQARANFRYFWRELAWERTQLAQSLGWDNVVALLKSAEASPDQYVSDVALVAEVARHPTCAGKLGVTRAGWPLGSVATSATCARQC